MSPGNTRTGGVQSQEPFTKQDFRHATGWSGSTLDTHWSKHFKPFVVVIGGGRYRVSEGFRPFANWRKFQRHVTQTRPVAADYTRLAYDNVVMYEFFMPLTNETALRTTLDALFFKDNIIPKLRAIGAEKLSQHLSIKDGEAAEKYFERICDWIDSHFVGYSVYHFTAVLERLSSQPGNRSPSLRRRVSVTSSTKPPRSRGSSSPARTMERRSWSDTSSMPFSSRPSFS